jgi:hypothetical protein
MAQFTEHNAFKYSSSILPVQARWPRCNQSKHDLLKMTRPGTCQGWPGRQPLPNRGGRVLQQGPSTTQLAPGKPASAWPAGKAENAPEEPSWAARHPERGYPGVEGGRREGRPTHVLAGQTAAEGKERMATAADCGQEPTKSHPARCLWPAR